MEFPLDQSGVMEMGRRAVPHSRAAQSIAAKPAQLPGLVVGGSSFSGGHGSSELRPTIGLPAVSQCLAGGDCGRHSGRQLARRTLRQCLGPSLTGARRSERLQQPGAHRQRYEIERSMNQCAVNCFECLSRLAQGSAQSCKFEP